MTTQMIDPRIYRVALVPVLLAFVLLAFSLEDRPRAMTATLAPDAFEGRRAFDRAYRPPDGLASRFADRRPGSAGDERLAGLVQKQMREAEFRVRTVEHEGETIDGARRLRLVIAERAGTIDEKIVVVAHRDAAGSGAEAELSATAALLELARLFGAPRQTQRTLTLVSTSGGSGGAAGAARLARELHGPIGAVLVLGDLASRNVSAPLVTPWSNALGATPQRLRATVQEAVRAETGSGAGPQRALSQLTRFALPATFGEQGALLEAGLPAVMLGIGGDRPPPANAPIARRRLQGFGRAALRTVTALDAAPAARPISPRASDRDVLTSRKVLPAWAMRLFTGALLLAPVLAAVDAFAAVRRRREPVLVWVRWTLACALPFALAGLFVIAIGAIGLLTAAPPAPASPTALPVQLPALLAAALVLVLGWVWLRPAVVRVARADGDPGDGAAAAVVVLLLGLAVAIAVWIGNPYAAALLAPALHLWLLALAPERGMRRTLGVLAVVAGVLPLAIVAIALSRGLGLGLVNGAWELLLAVAGGHISLLGVALWSLVAGCGAGALLIALRGRDRFDDGGPAITVRGPATYAGPGSLGGTESALKR